ncbi:phosphotransferase [uncultured Prevotella sp.]|uniref:phosphotransferase n=1 Tax=uncultured Prevotella sp. TaxID=159272 RepID=UPI00258F0605|nr:phosphotransferase [uncultured Prevotella sp.]
MMKTAVILSARKDKGTDIPYPLKPYCENICLMDRIIEALTALDYSNIYLVVGDKAELYHKYASERVHLVLNADYKFTSSMGSLAVAAPFIDDDFLLVEGDTFYEYKVLKSLTETANDNCFAITEESGSGDEAFVETRKGYVAKISKDRHQICNFEGEMLGIVKISKPTFDRMMQKWNHSNNPYLNYEYLLLDSTDVLDRPYIRFTNLIWGDVDCEDDFNKLCNYIYPKLRRKEAPFDYDNLISYLNAIFPNEHIEKEVSIMQIGGMSNKNFKVTKGKLEYVLRVPGNGSEGMVVRSNEEQNSRQACKMGINPPIRYFNAKTGIKLADFVKNAETLNGATIQRPSSMKKIVKIFQTLHHSHVRFGNEFNVFNEIRNYERLLEECNGTMYEGYEDHREKVLRLEDYLNKLGVSIKPCHNDLVAENFLKAEDGTIYLIDWEYSGMNDPMWDIAALFLENNFSEENQDYFLSHYFNGKEPENARKKIFVYQILMDWLWSLWTVIKEAQGDDFGTYGVDRYTRAIENLKKIEL